MAKKTNGDQKIPKSLGRDLSRSWEIEASYHISRRNKIELNYNERNLMAWHLIYDPNSRSFYLDKILMFADSHDKKLILPNESHNSQLIKYLPKKHGFKPTYGFNDGGIRYYLFTPKNGNKVEDLFKEFEGKMDDNEFLREINKKKGIFDPKIFDWEDGPQHVIEEALRMSFKKDFYGKSRKHLEIGTCSGGRISRHDNPFSDEDISMTDHNFKIYGPNNQKLSYFKLSRHDSRAKEIIDELF